MENDIPKTKEEISLIKSVIYKTLLKLNLIKPGDNGKVNITVSAEGISRYNVRKDYK